MKKNFSQEKDNINTTKKEITKRFNMFFTPEDE